MIMTYQLTQFIECLLVFQGSAQRPLPGSSWLPPGPHPPHAPPGWGPRGSMSLWGDYLLHQCLLWPHLSCPGLRAVHWWRPCPATWPRGPGDGEGRALPGGSPTLDSRPGVAGTPEPPPPSACCLFQLPRFAATCARCLGVQEPALPPRPVPGSSKTHDAPEQSWSWWELSRQ